MKRIRIKVTAGDIKRGVKGDGECCPVALATKRCARVLDVHVSPNHFDIGKWTSPDSFCGDTPTAVRNFVSDFDAGKKVKPFSFTIQMPESQR